MVKLVVEGITKEIGPGDIVGAFANIARIDVDKIGKISFKRDKAYVQVERDIAKKIINVMDGNQIGGVNVGVYPRSPEDLLEKKVYDYYQKYSNLVELEREEEMNRHLEEIKYLSGRERERRGRAILHLRGRDQGEGYGGKHLIKFVRQRPGEELPETEIQVGDLVMLSKKNPLDSNNPTGTVVEKTGYSLTCVFDQKPPKFLYKKGLRLDLYVNDITFQRMLEALSILSKAEGRLKELREVLLGDRQPVFDSLPEINFKLEHLNDSQKNAVKKAQAARDVFLIHGPPGTGKTMTCIEVILQNIEQMNTILATADSNTAVDNMVERLVREEARVVRVGHPARVTPLLREHTLDYLVQDHPLYKKALKVRKRAGKLLDKQDDLAHPSGRWCRGMSNEKILSLAKKNRGSRGVPAHKIKEMAEWLKLQEKIDALFEEIDELEEKALNELLKGADVICATNSTSGSELLANYKFDLVVIDEATQATEPSALIPLIKAKKVILAGDHKQLPPTVLSKEADENGLSKSLFERLYAIHGDQIRSLLRTQYRMHNLIMEFSNNQFYEGKLEAAPGIGDQKITDLDVRIPAGNTPSEKVLKESAISFLDTKSLNAPERSRGDSNSFENFMEVELVRECTEVALRSGANPREIAIISPYKDQVDLIRDKVQVENLEIDTVDGFQGREKEIVIFSCVRSNEYGNIGFLRDLRRLNVAMTRAKKRLIIIGDSSTITSNPVYEALVEYIRKNGFYYHL